MDDQVADVTQLARETYRHALTRADIDEAMKAHVTADGVNTAGQSVPWPKQGRLAVFALGKAAVTLAEAFARRLPAQVRSQVDAVVAGPLDPQAALPHLPAEGRWRYWQGGHPLPNEASLTAGKEALALARSLGPQDMAVFLVSGGASAMCDQPLDPALGLAELVATHRALVGCGAPIAQINAVRKHLSALKGGRLAEAAAGAGAQISLFVSDVPPGALDALASGPTLPDTSTVADVRHLLAATPVLAATLPPHVGALLADPGLAETLKPGHAAFAHARHTVLLDSTALEKYASERLIAAGYDVEIDREHDDLGVAKAMDGLLTRLEALRARHPGRRVALISAGEVTVTLPNTPGTGGRNLHFALLCAQRIAGRPITVLSAGSDGIDGTSPAAGAVVDGSTWARAEAEGLNPGGALAAFNAHAVLDALGATIVTGPSGQNLRDLRLLLAG